MSHYRFKALGHTASYKPSHSYLMIEDPSTGYLYTNDQNNPEKLYKSTDKNENMSLIVTRTHEIISAFPDFSNDKIYFTSGTLMGDTYAWYLDLTDDSDNTIGNKLNNQNFLLSDIWIRDGNLEASIKDGIGGDLEILQWQDPNWVSINTNATSGYMSRVTIIGTDAYFWIDRGGSIYMAKYDGADITILDDIGATSAVTANPTTPEIWHMTYDEDDIIHAVLYDDGTATNYLYSYSITDDEWTKLDAYSIILQMNRFNSGTIPSEYEKAFGYSTKIVYEIKPRRGGVIQLQDLSDLSDANIIAITDNFLMNIDRDMFEWTDVMDYISDISVDDSILGGSTRTNKNICTFRSSPDYEMYWAEGDSIKVYDPNDVLCFWGYIITEFIGASDGIAYFTCEGMKSEGYHRTYEKSYSADDTDTKQKDVIDNALYYCYRSNSIAGTTTTYDYEYNRACFYLFWLARFLERQVCRIEPDGLIYTEAYNAITKQAQHYAGSYNLRGETVGTTDDSIGFIDNVSANDSTYSATITATEGNHKNIIKFLAAGDNGKYARWDHVLSTDQTTGTIEKWVKYIDKGVGVYYMYFYDASANHIFSMYFNSADNKFYVNHGDGVGGTTTSSANATSDTWYRLKIIFNSNTNTFSVNFNDSYIVDNEPYRNDMDGDDLHQYQFQLSGGAGANSLECYLDAVGESWDPNYTVGDNVAGWTLDTSHQKVYLKDIPKIDEATPGYFKGSLGITSVLVRYFNNQTAIRPASPDELTRMKRLREFRDPKLMTSTEANQLGDNLYNIFSTTTIFLGVLVEGEGWLQPGKTLSIQASDQLTITNDDFLLLRTKYDPKNDIHEEMILTDNIIFPSEFKTNFNTSPFQTHTAITQTFENQATTPHIYSSAGDPTVNDDVDLGYKICDIWNNTTDKGTFICRDNADGAADWKEI